MHWSLNGGRPGRYTDNLIRERMQRSPPGTDQSLICCVQGPVSCERLGWRLFATRAYRYVTASFDRCPSFPPLQTCILAGCDFLPNIAGLGIKKAHALIRKHKDFVKVRRQGPASLCLGRRAGALPRALSFLSGHLTRCALTRQRLSPQGPSFFHARRLHAYRSGRLSHTTYSRPQTPLLLPTKVIRALRFGGTSIPAGYDVTFQRTVWLFRHQRVWCPGRRQMAHMRPLPEGGLGARDVLVLAALPPEGPEREALPFLGPPMEHQLAEGIARGE